MAVNRIYIQVDLQSQGAEAGVKALNKELQGIGTTSAQSSQVAATGVKGFTVAIDQASSAANGLAQALTGLGIARLIQELARMGDELIRLSFAFDRMAGGAEAMQEIRKAAIEMHVDIAKAEQGVLDLNKAGLSMKDSVALWKALTNAIAATGGSSEATATAINSFANSMAREQLTVRSIVGLRVAGIQGIEVIKKYLGESRQKAAEDLRFITPESFAKVVTYELDLKNAGAAAALGQQTLSGHMQDLKNKVSELSEELDKALGPSLGKLIDLLTKVVDLMIKATKAFEQLPEPIRDAVVVAGTLAVTLGTIGTAMRFIGSIGAAVGAAFGWVTRLAGGFAELLGFGEGIIGLFGTIAAEEIGLGPILGTIALIISGIVYAINLANKLKSATGGAGEKPKLVTEADEEKLKKQLEASQSALDEARMRNLKAGKDAIGAYVIEYDAALRKLEGTEKQKAAAVANYRLALELNVDSEIKKRQEESRKENLKSLEEIARVQRQITIAAAEVMPDESYAGRRQVLQVREQAYAAQLIADKNYKVAELEREDALEEESARKALQRAGKSALEISIAVGKIHTDFLGKEVLEGQKAQGEIQHHRLETEKATNELILEQRKELAAETLQDAISVINRQAQLAQATLEARKEPRVQDRLAQLQAISDVQIKNIEGVRDAQIKANADYLQQYRDDHLANTEGIAELEAKNERERVRLTRDADTEIQLNRYNLWKETDQAIAEEQARFYDAIKGELGQLWDAFTGKTKSVWTAIGNVIKNSLMNTFKDVVTSRLAGAFTGVLTGYPGPTFPHTLGGPAYAPLGAPPRPRELESIDSTMKPLMDAAVQTIQTTDIVVAGLSRSADDLSSAAAELFVAARELRSGADTGGADYSGQGEASREMTAEDIARFGGGTSTQVAARGGLSGSLGNLSRLVARFGGGGAAAATAAAAGGISAASLPDYFGTLPAGVPSIPASGVSGSGISPAMASIGIGTNPLAHAQNFTLHSALNNLKSSFNIGENVAVAGGSIPWSEATLGQKLGSVLSSEAVGSLALSTGTALAMGGLAKNSTAGRTQAVLGGALGGLGAAALFPSLGFAGAAGLAGGAAAGAGLALAAAGVQRGGALGFGMSVGGGALTGAMLGTFLLPGIGTAVGALIGAGAGAIAGGIRLLVSTKDEQLRKALREKYGTDITSKPIRDQIMQIIDTKYGGSISLGILSQDVQDIVRLWGLSTGQGANLPRPMYAASFAQNNGSLQMQPVYSGGHLVANPYTGTTTTQVANALTTATYVQLNPSQASSLFAGQVVQVLGSNPAAVSDANTTAARSGMGRQAQQSALLEPSTVTR